MDLDLKDIKKAQKNASEKALRLNRALGLPYIEANNANLIAVDSEGNKTMIGEARFGLRKVSRRRFKLDGE
ncbi:hypothetical protein [Cyclobacterium plantarum]|uniref:hypothetical protein n=1 Tax=Cyclobacterium plantarum TaxID=2716263 RepID=UPI003F70A39F